MTDLATLDCLGYVAAPIAEAYRRRGLFKRRVSRRASGRSRISAWISVSVRGSI